jgi:hypothetical protein
MKQLFILVVLVSIYCTVFSQECKPAPIGQSVFFDPTCSNSSISGLGCIVGQNCRFCGFDSYLACPTTTATPETTISVTKPTIISTSNQTTVSTEEKMTTSISPSSEPNLEFSTSQSNIATGESAATVSQVPQSRLSQPSCVSQKVI